jgi:phage tail-like protein
MNQLPTVTRPRGRGLVLGLETRHPIGQYLPGLYQDDNFALRLTEALDLALAPVFSTLDNFESYLDPWLAPEDFVDWLGSWMGLLLDERLPLDRKRAFVAQAWELFRIRGTRRGLQRVVEVITGGNVEVSDTGGAASATAPGAAFPGSPNFAVLVRIRVDDPAGVSRGYVESLVSNAKPAHVTHRVEITSGADVTDAVEVSSA